ncbi:MAG: hypothetical protein GY757_21570, partial [bacterium]|nr:hypothetical protein [bacterium]
MKTKKILICVLIFAFFFNVAYAGTAADTEKKKSKEEKEQEDLANTPSLKAIGQDIGKIYTSPFRMKKKDFLVWGGVALVTGVLIANDEKIYREIKDYQADHKWVDDVSPTITKLGLGEYNLGIAGLFYLGGMA